MNFFYFNFFIVYTNLTFYIYRIILHLPLQFAVAEYDEKKSCEETIKKKKKNNIYVNNIIFLTTVSRLSIFLKHLKLLTC